MKHVISPDTGRPDRLPPGQVLVREIPVLHYSAVPEIADNDYRLSFKGLGVKASFGFKQILELPETEVFCDLHCVTDWTYLGAKLTGIAVSDILTLCPPPAEAKFVMIHCLDGYCTNLSLEEFAAPDCIFALTLNGKPTPAIHGHPFRLFVPRLYLWKSAKWANCIEYMTKDSPGYWENRGYHIHGDPWKEERYSG